MYTRGVAEQTLATINELRQGEHDPLIESAIKLITVGLDQNCWPVRQDADGTWVFVTLPLLDRLRQLTHAAEKAVAREKYGAEVIMAEDLLELCTTVVIILAQHMPGDAEAELQRFISVVENAFQ